MSSWFGSGSSKSATPAPAEEDHGFSGAESGGFSNSANFAGNGISGAGAGGLGGGMTSDPQMALRMALAQEQQKAVVQAAISKLTELCWESCVQRPEAKLSSSDQQCIAHCAERYLDTANFIAARFQKGGR
jgi:hypothetical protein